MSSSNKQEAVFDLIKRMSKAEKRNFKLYATRGSGNQDAKFIALFDVMDSLEEYDEPKILKRCPVKKEQLPNMKAHLYRQILVSIRLLDVQHSASIEFREQIDFAKILYDMGLYRQSLKILDKTKAAALDLEYFTIALEIVELEKSIEALQVQRSHIGHAHELSAEADSLTGRISRINVLSNMSIQLYTLQLQLGYIRSEKDMKLVRQYFKIKLDSAEVRDVSFSEKLYLYKCWIWYSYIQFDFVMCFKYARRLVDLFESKPEMKSVMYDNFFRGYSRLLDVLFLVRRYDSLVHYIDKLEYEMKNTRNMSENGVILSNMAMIYGKINRNFMDGDFEQGIQIASYVDKFIEKYGSYVNQHNCMLMYYKVACLYFGNGDYEKCIEYLQRIISVRDPQFRRDLQCFARILNLIASYELGVDYNLDYQIKSVYGFIVKMNDMHEVQHELILFLKRLGHIYESDFRQELIKLYDRLKPFESHPYLRRPFFYLDIISWLESKIQGKTMGEVIKEKFNREVRHGQR